MRLGALLSAVTVWSIPALAFACPVCFDANEANRDAYLGTTILLSLLPLAFIGGVLLVLRKRAREREKAHETSPIRLSTPGDFSICNVTDDAR
ncbi:MAG: hypothetical protein KC619_29115 [Myxococcales bacterium]|nr:hypothetical protein [Myxococcales bacterium]